MFCTVEYTLFSFQQATFFCTYWRLFSGGKMVDEGRPRAGRTRPVSCHFLTGRASHPPCHGAIRPRGFSCPASSLSAFEQISSQRLALADGPFPPLAAHFIVSWIAKRPLMFWLALLHFAGSFQLTRRTFHRFLKFFWILTTNLALIILGLSVNCSFSARGILFRLIGICAVSCSLNGSAAPLSATPYLELTCHVHRTPCQAEALCRKQVSSRKAHLHSARLLPSALCAVVGAGPATEVSAQTRENGLIFIY